LDLGPLTTAASGDFSIPASEPLAEGGTYTFTASYAGDSGHAGSTATATVTVPKLVTTLTLNGTSKTLVYGHSLTLTAHLAGAPEGMVTITRDVSGVKSVAASGPVNSAGNLVFAAHPRQNTAYTATYTGDLAHAASTSKVWSVTVSPILITTLSPWYATSGRYRLYHYHRSCPSSGKDCPVYTIKFKPSNPRHTVYAVIQVAVSGKWKNDVVFKGTLGPKSMAAIKLRYANTSIIGHRFRIAAVSKPGTKYGGAVSGFSYFRITN
jgi:hypothetical protein